MLEIRLTLLLMAVLVGCTSLTKPSRNYYKNMSNLSKYESVRGDIRRANMKYDSCVPLKIWIFHRHGTRLPSSTEITDLKTLPSIRDAVIENHKNGRGVLSNEQLNRLKQWTFDESMEAIPMYLTDEGYNETHRTSLRFKEKFPKLLNRKYSKQAFYFRHSDTQRTMRTTHAFIDGLFGDGAHNHINATVKPVTDDPLLYPFGGACKKLTELITSPAHLAGQILEFQKSEEYLAALKDISLRLGFEKTLAPSSLTAIFGACAYDLAWNQEHSKQGAWCPVLTEADVQIGEYYWDLLLYAMGGYGHRAIEKGACKAPQDLWERFSAAVDGGNISDKTEDLVAYFSHDAVIMQIHTALGLLKDNPALRGNNYGIQKNRKWKSSHIVPFASNLLAVLQKCKTPSLKTEYEVLLFRNENPWNDITVCPKGVCKWADFKSVFKPVAESCNFEDFC